MLKIIAESIIDGLEKALINIPTKEKNFILKEFSVFAEVMQEYLQEKMSHEEGTMDYERIEHEN